jgi:hypothetical protein
LKSVDCLFCHSLVFWCVSHLSLWNNPSVSWCVSFVIVEQSVRILVYVSFVIVEQSVRIESVCHVLRLIQVNISTFIDNYLLDTDRLFHNDKRCKYSVLQILKSSYLNGILFALPYLGFLITFLILL